MTELLCGCHVYEHCAKCDPEAFAQSSNKPDLIERCTAAADKPNAWGRLSLYIRQEYLDDARAVLAEFLAAARADGAAEMRERCELIALRSRDELQPCPTSYRGIGPEWNMANKIVEKIRGNDALAHSIAPPTTMK